MADQEEKERDGTSVWQMTEERKKASVCDWDLMNVISHEDRMLFGAEPASLCILFSHLAPKHPFDARDKDSSFPFRASCEA